jgi:hypothetical protein
VPLYGVGCEIEKILLYFLEPFGDVACGLILIGLSDPWIKITGESLSVPGGNAQFSCEFRSFAVLITKRELA